MKIKHIEPFEDKFNCIQYLIDKTLKKNIKIKDVLTKGITIGEYLVLPPK